MKHFSLLDLSPITEGTTAADSFARTVAMAQLAEAKGYRRYWLAEHHNMPGIASAATSLLIGHVAANTSRIRVGAGGIMLPNHAPLVIAEQFGTLATLYPNRIDLGLGRAPGTDGNTARALRRHMAPEDSFPQDVQELIGYLGPARAGAAVRAIPGEGTQVPVWILGSSLYGAQLAAHFGLPYAFASHFAPAMLEQAAMVYRENFKPSDHLSAPHLMVAAGVCAADTDAAAERLRSSQLLAFARLRTGQAGQLPPPTDALSEIVPSQILAGAQAALSFAATGSRDSVRKRFAQMIDALQPDELMVTGMIYDADAQMRSVEIAADVLADLQLVAA